MSTTIPSRPRFRPPGLIERIVCALTPPVFGAFDNRLDTEAFRDGKGLMVGDVVKVRTWFGRHRRGEISQLHNKEAFGRRVHDRYFTLAIRVSWDAGDHYFAPSRVRLVERSRSYRQQFLTRYPAHETWEVYRERDIDRDLQESSVPGSNLTRDLTDAMLALGLYGDPDKGRTTLADLLRRADIVEAGLPGRADWRHPRTRAQTLICRSLAAAALGEPLNHSDMNAAADLMLQDCAEIPPGYWDVLGKGGYLLAVMCVMLIGDDERARDLLKSRRSFRGLEDLRRVLRQMVRRRSPTPGNPAQTQYAIDCLDCLRHPFLSLHRDTTNWLGVLLLSAVLVQRLDGPNKTLDWELIAERLYA